MSRLSDRMRPALIFSACAILVAGIVLGISHWTGAVSTAAPNEPDESKSAPNASQNSGEPTDVELTKAKAIQADIQTERVKRSDLTHKHSVPGRVAYNDNQHIEIKAPSAGVLVQVTVQPGDLVAARQVLAWLNSPEIGATRADVLKRQADLEIAKTVHDRQSRISQNVRGLSQSLKRRDAFDSIKKTFASQLLGDYRSQLFGAYARLILAEAQVANSTSAAESGAIAGRVYLQHQAEARSAQAALDADCEQAEQDVLQAAAEATSIFQDANRRWLIARQHLSSLLMDDDALNVQPDSIQVSEPSSLASDARNIAGNGAARSDDNLSRVAIRAPFAGTIESRNFTARERVQLADSLFVLADTRSLWITAEIRENDWPAMQITAGQSISVTVPALGDRQFEAKVEFVGRAVSPDSNAIPIVAEIDNSAGQLRPGLFVRVSLPMRQSGAVMAIDVRAIQQHDGQTFVFVSLGGNRFRRVNVTTGEQSEHRVEITSGLKIGDGVVTHGAFVLKSELLLEGEGQ